MTANQIPGWPKKQFTNDLEPPKLHYTFGRNDVICEVESALAPYELIPKELLTKKNLLTFSKAYDIYFMGDQHRLAFFTALRLHLGLSGEGG